MTYDVAADVRLDPRLKEILARIPVEPAGNVDSREAGSWIAGRRAYLNDAIHALTTR